MKNLLLSSLFLFSIFSTSIGQTPGVQWQKKLNNFLPNSNANIIYGMSKVKSGGFIFAGTDTIYLLDSTKILNKEYGSRPYITRTDNAGKIIWSANLQNYTRNSFYNCVIQSGNDEFIAAGSIDDYIDSTSAQLTVSKYKIDGALEWNKNFGGSSIDGAHDIIQSNDGNYVVAGYTYSNNFDVSGNHGNADFWLIKIDAAGNLLWQKCFGGSGDDKAYSIQQTSDGGYIVAGTTSSSDGNISANKGYMDGWVIKLDKAGNLQWEKCFGGTSEDAFKSVSQNADGSFILTGYTYSNDKDVTGNHGWADVWVVKIDISGNILWQKCVGGTNQEYGSSLEKTIDGAYIISGYTHSNDGDVTGLNGGADAWLVKISDSGNLIWTKTVGTNKNEYGTAIKVISENEFFLTEYGDPAFPREGYYVETNLYKLGNSSVIKGNVFLDYNKNGTKESREPYFNNIKIKTEKQDYLREFIPSNGSFNIEVDTGTYKTSAAVNNPYYTVVPASATSVFSSYFASDTINFAVQQIPNKRDLSVNLIELMPARPGFKTSYKILYKNQGTDTIASGTVQLVKSNKLTVISSSPASGFIKGDTLRWNYSNLKPEDTVSIVIDLTVDAPPSVGIGDMLTSIATISPVTADETPSDDTSRLVQRVVGSFDPNDKTEKNGGMITSSQVTNGDYLLYTIRFQNTGTDTAFNITIRDTLDSKVDWNTLKMVSSSHNYQLDIKEGNKLTWSFNNIQLPDSNVNEAKSNGYVVYSIKPKISLLPGDTINNTASIYFDFNLPVQTNTEQTVVESVVLPIKLSGFTAIRNGKQNEIEWNISKELNIAAFEVERSSTGRDFAKIGMIKETNTSKYQLTDFLPLKAINFYRLKIIYKDGTFEYSQIKSVNNSGSFDLSIYPNPVKNNLAVRVNSEKKTDISIKITAMDGKVIQSIKYIAPAGSIIRNINASSLSKGTYFLLLSSQTEQAGIKFEKL